MPLHRISVEDNGSMKLQGKRVRARPLGLAEYFILGENSFVLNEERDRLVIGKKELLETIASHAPKGANAFSLRNIPLGGQGVDSGSVTLGNDVVYPEFTYKLCLVNYYKVRDPRLEPLLF